MYNFSFPDSHCQGEYTFPIPGLECERYSRYKPSKICRTDGPSDRFFHYFVEKSKCVLLIMMINVFLSFKSYDSMLEGIQDTKLRPPSQKNQKNTVFENDDLIQNRPIWS